MWTLSSPTVAHSFPNGVWLVVRKPGLQKLANCCFEKQVCQTIFGLLCVWTFNGKTISRKLCCFKLKTLDTAVFTEVLCCYLAFSTCCASQNVISNLVREQLCVNMVFVVILESALWSVNYIQLSCYSHLILPATSALQDQSFSINGLLQCILLQ